MEKLELKKNRFGLKVTCSKCNKTYNHESLKKCNHAESQKHKVIVYKKNGLAFTENLNTRDYKEALIQAIEIKAEIKSEGLCQRNNKPTILELADEYIDFKKGINVPVMYQKNLGDKYTNSIQADLKDFLSELKKNGISPENEELKKVTPEIGDIIYNKIINKYSRGSYRTKFTHLRNFIDWCIEEKGINVKNIFKKIHIPRDTSPIEGLTSHEFNAIIKEVKKGSLKVEVKDSGRIKKKEAFKDYLATYFTLAILTGLRRSELIELKWSHLGMTKDGKQLVFVIVNNKVERQFQKEYRPKIIPVNKELYDFLEQLKLKEKIDSDEYIIHPERYYTITSMKNDVSFAFRAYYRKVFPQRTSKPFNSLRKTYITHSHTILGKDVVKFTSHSGEQVLKEHYIDTQLVGKMIKNLNILG